MAGLYFPGYTVTEDGKVFSTDTNWRGYGQREMQQSLNDDGYPSVRVTIDGKRKHFAVHRLVAHVFLEDRPTPDHEIRHLDGDKMNNRAANLAWGTVKENAEDREKHGRTSRGESHSIAIKKGFIQASQARAAIRKARGEV